MSENAITVRQALFNSQMLIDDCLSGNWYKRFEKRREIEEEEALREHRKLSGEKEFGTKLPKKFSPADEGEKVAEMKDFKGKVKVTTAFVERCYNQDKWCTADGRVIEIQKMGDRHLSNCAKFLQRDPDRLKTAMKGFGEQYLRKLEAELERRMKLGIVVK